jgi:Ca2+-binding EF-hand superfamily protein
MYSSGKKGTHSPISKRPARRRQGLDEEQVAEIKEAFALFDTESSG